MDEGQEAVALDLALPEPPMPPLRDVRDKLKFEYCRGEYYTEVFNMVRKYKAEYIVNLVTSYSPEDLELNPLRAIRVNLDTQVNVLEAARTFGVKRVVFISTGHVYGGGRKDIVDEQSLLRPDTLYGACKTMNEYLAQHYNELYGIDYIALRISLLYGWGRRQRATNRDTWIVDLFENAVKGSPTKIPYASQKGSVVYVKDVVSAILAAMKVENLKHRVFDVVSEPRSKLQAIEIVKRLIPNTVVEVDLEGAFGSRRKKEDRTARAWENKRITQELGFKPAYSFEEGIKDYIEMFRADKYRW
jgi:nucleoside-diphosphate-sugar epimerase